MLSKPFLRPAILGPMLGALCACASVQALAQCYTVYDRSNRALYQGREAPVDMSRPLHDTMPRAFPGGHLVFDNLRSCNELRPLTPPDTARMGNGAAPKVSKEITELRDAHVRVIREGDRLTIEPLEGKAR